MVTLKVTYLDGDVRQFSLGEDQEFYTWYVRPNEYGVDHLFLKRYPTPSASRVMIAMSAIRFYELVRSDEPQAATDQPVTTGEAGVDQKAQSASTAGQHSAFDGSFRFDDFARAANAAQRESYAKFQAERGSKVANAVPASQPEPANVEPEAKPYDFTKAVYPAGHTWESCREQPCACYDARSAHDPF